MISQRMKDAAWAMMHKLLPNGPNNNLYLEQAVQAAIYEAWPAFDPEDKATWPKSDYAPSGRMWLKLHRDGSFDFGTWRKNHVLWIGPNFDITHYADPADIGPTQKGETP